MAGKRSVEVQITGDAKSAVREMERLERKAKDTDDALEDVGTAGEKLARAIERSADDMISEIDATARAVAELERALGPEFDADTRDVVADLKKLGLTADDIEADAEQLAAALRRVDDVKVHAARSGFDDLGQAVGNVDNDIGRTKDTMSGFIGGTVGELPGISQAMGPVSEGLGQLTEGALAGEINFKQLAVAGGAMAGVAFVLDKVQGRLERIAQYKAWRTEQVEAYEEALLETGDTAAAVAQKISDAGELQVKALQGILDIDVVPHLAAAGLTAEHFGEIVAGGAPKLQEWQEAAQAAGVSTEAIGGVSLAAAQEIALVADAEVAAAATAAVFGESTDDAAEAADRQADAVKRAADALRDEADALNEQIDAQRASVDAAYAVTAAEFAYNDAVQSTVGTLNTATVGGREHTEASIELAKAAQDVADAKVREADETAKAAGKTLTATARTDILNKSILDQAAALNGPQRAAILDHLTRLNNIPADKRTEIEAALDAGDITTAENILNTTSRTRTSAVNADANTWDAENKLNQLARDRTARVVAQAVGNIPSFGWGSGRADGGPVRAGTIHPVGERGEPELLEQNGRQYLIPGANGVVTPMAAAGGGAPSITYVTVNMPAGVDPTSAMRAVRRYQRRNGS